MNWYELLRDIVFWPLEEFKRLEALVCTPLGEHPDDDPMLKEEAMSELEQCPFCGSEAEILYGEGDERPHSVACSVPGCLGYHDFWFEIREDAVAAWNRRAGQEGSHE